tara:strand:+ start:4079 stop:4915 length:837 start_codon:yes stop_codon:yes gene_type:complete
MKILIIVSLFFISCNTPQTYKVIGVIKDIDKDQNKLLIDHEEIPGFMVKMVMYFNLHSSIDINQFAIDDSVSFDLIIKNKNSYTLNYENLGKSLINADDDDFWNNDTESKYSLKKPGEYIENSTFLTLDNKEISLSDYNSDFTLITFIFSKCPMPNMCPASIVKNQYLSNYFKNENINFLLISFDYIYDTPEVLKNIYGPIETNNMKFLSSYNHIDDIFSLAQQSGVAYWGVEENNIGHSMRSVLIDKDLKLIKTFDGIDWKAGEAKKDILNLLKIYK